MGILLSPEKSQEETRGGRERQLIQWLEGKQGSQTKIKTDRASPTPFCGIFIRKIASFLFLYILSGLTAMFH